MTEIELQKLQKEFTVDDHCFWENSEDPKRKTEIQNRWEDVSEQMQTEMETFAIQKLQKEFTVDDHCFWENSEDPKRKTEIQNRWEDVSEQMQTEMETFAKESTQDAGNLLEQMQIENRERYDYREFLRKFSGDLCERKYSRCRKSAGTDAD